MFFMKKYLKSENGFHIYVLDNMNSKLVQKQICPGLNPCKSARPEIKVICTLLHVSALHPF